VPTGGNAINLSCKSKWAGQSKRLGRGWREVFKGALEEDVCRPELKSDVG